MICPEAAVTTMKAVRIRSFGGPEVLELADVDKPEPRDDEVLIQVHEIDLVLDLIAGETQERSWRVLKEGGTMISSLARPSEEQARRPTRTPPISWPTPTGASSSRSGA